MGLNWTADIRDRVCLVLLQQPYSGLRADEQTLLDGAISGGTLPVGLPDKGVARDALMRVRQTAQWFEEAGVVNTTGSTATGPDVWEPVLIQEAVFKFAQALRPSDLRSLAPVRAEAWRDAIDSFAVNNFADATQLFGAGDLSPQRIRLHVMRHMTRRTPRVLPPVAEIDLAIEWAINRLWESRVSLYRARHVIVTIPTASGGQTPTYTLLDGSSLPSGEVVDSVISAKMYFTDTVGRDSRSTIRWGLVEEFTEHRALQQDTGRPELFRIEQRGATTLLWRWSPEPDVQYTAQALVMVKAPVLGSAASDTATLAKFPREYKTIIPDLVLAKCLQKYAVQGWQDDWRLAQKAIDDLLAFSEQAAVLPALQQQDVYNDFGRQADSSVPGGW